MVLEAVCCSTWHTPDVVKNSKSNEGKQRYRCHNTGCSRVSFIRDYTYRGYLPEVNQQMSDIAMNGSGIQNIDRVLKISPTTVIEELKTIGTCNRLTEP